MHLVQFSVGNSPTYRFLTLLLVTSLFSISINADSDSRKNNPSLIGRFWEIGCEFSGVVSRVRRSAPNPPPEEPNFDDPEELFNYLYPLADVKPGDDPIGSQRSAHGTHSLSSWLEDLMELWHSECLHRRKKRSAERREDYKNKASGGETWSTKTHRIRGRVDRAQPASTEGGRNSSLEESLSKTMSGRRGDNRDDGDINTYQNYANDGQGTANGELHGYGGAMDHTSNGDNYEGYWRNGEDKKPTTTTTAAPTTAAPTPPAPPPAPPAPAEDIFFSQYGGDIEYFFPLLSFGIPFDGEITLLGFHGFHGLFPY